MKINIWTTVFSLWIGHVLCNVDINLEGNWLKTPFSLSLIESITGHDESLYLSTVSKILGVASDDEEVDVTPLDSFSDQGLYELVLDQLDPIGKSYADFALANKYYSPRIQTHYQYYNDVVRPSLGARLKKQCSSDSFGNNVIEPGQDLPDVWLLFNDKVYCSTDDLYALQTDSKSDLELLPFDRVIGESGPLMVLYGDITSKRFHSFFVNLYQSAQVGKLRFVWRYLPDPTVTENEVLSGYGVDLTLKRTDYIVIDDRDIQEQASEISGAIEGSNFWEKYNDDIEAISKSDITELDLKLTSYILDKNYNLSQYEMLNVLLQDFPKFASSIKDETINPEVLANVQHNQEIGLNSESSGIYVNGAPINKLELDIYKLFHKIEDEKKIIDDLERLGFGTSQSKELIQKFALLSAVKNKKHGWARYDVYKDPNVVFFNDLELDQAYAQYSPSRDAYFSQLKPGQIPLVKENIHEIIFAINLSEVAQLEVFFSFAKLILDKGIPQQVGLIPLIDNDADAKYAREFFYEVEKHDAKEGIAYLFQLLGGDPPPVRIHPRYPFKHNAAKVADKYKIDTPSVIFNGVFYDLGSQWQYSLGRQLQYDIQLLQYYVMNGLAGKKDKLKDFLFAEAKSTRNLRIEPDRDSSYTFKTINQELSDLAVTFRKSLDNASYDFSNAATFWLVGDLDNTQIIEQLIDLLEVLKTKDNIQLKVLSTSKSKLLQELENISGRIQDSDISILLGLARAHLQDENRESVINEQSIKLLEDSKLPHSAFVLFNSRYFRIGERLSQSDLKLLIEHESENRLKMFEQIFENFSYDINSIVGNQDFLNWFDEMTSIVTNSFYRDDDMFISDVARFDFSKLNDGNSVRVSEESDEEKAIDILVIIDPIDEYSQKLVSIVNSVKEFPFVNIKILLQPQSEIEEISIKRFFRGVYPSSVNFDSDGKLHDKHQGLFELVPKDTLFTLDLDVPQSWVVMIKDSASDLDNVKLANSGPVKGVYELKNILVEGYAKDIKDINPPTGASVELRSIGSTTPISDTNILSNLGYLQLKANPGLYDLSLKTGSKTSDIYELLSADSNPFNSNQDPLSSVQLSVLNLEGLVIRPRLTKKAGHEQESLIVPDEENTKKSTGFLSNWFKPKSKNADINIFTVASGHLYERFLSIMTASVRKHTNHSVKFWLIENYMSPSFKKLLPHLSEKYNFQYELITYKWPNWLRGQREKQRTIWGYKILFLDVLFPQDLEKVIFVDSDQIIRTDLQELVDLDLEGAPYGYTPMCDSRKEMEGFRFWKQGYWEKVLGDDLKYHISALYVIDLKRFRDIIAGDRLRHHYQKLSSDPNSLSNLDQDLPNNMQRIIKIHSLPQEWLWCETWCSDESLKKAKTIDLCNNPLTKEPKLDRARRQIPEWSEYDNEIGELIESVKSSEKKIKLASSEESSIQITEVLSDETEDNENDHDEL